MTDPFDLNRRGLLFGLGAVGITAAAAPTLADVFSSPKPLALRPFETMSPDGTKLTGDIAGDEGAPGILFIHGLRQSHSKQDVAPMLASDR